MVRTILIAAGLLAGSMSPALAELRVCNGTGSAASFAIAYNAPSAGHWIASGWWTVAPGKCKTPLGGSLKDRYYYLYAYSAKKIWKGVTPVCVEPNKSFEFTFLKSDRICNYSWKYFYLVDTANATSFTARLR